MVSTKFTSVAILLTKNCAAIFLLKIFRLINSFESIQHSRNSKNLWLHPPCHLLVFLLLPRHSPLHSLHINYCTADNSATSDTLIKQVFLIREIPFRAGIALAAINAVNALRL